MAPRRRLLPREQRIIRRYLGRAPAEIQNLFLRSVEEQLGAIRLEQVSSAIAVQEAVPRIGQVYTYVRIETLIGAFQVNLEPLLRRLINRAGELALPVFDEVMAFASPTNLDLYRQLASQAAREIVAEQVTLIRRQARETIKRIVDEGFAERLSPDQIARRIRDVVGLDDRRAQALERFAARLRARPGDLTPAEVEHEIRLEYRRKLKSRAATIGRTETSHAAARAQRAIWDTAVAEGRLRPSRYVRVWMRVAGAQECPICGPLNGKRARLDGGYYESEGVTYDSPPGHPNCVCGETLEDWQEGDELLPVRAAA